MNRLSRSFSLAGAALLGLAAALAPAQSVTLTPYRASAIYAMGEKVGWTVAAPDHAAAAGGEFSYSIRENDLTVIKTGQLDLHTGPAKIELSLAEPAMLYLEVTSSAPDTKPSIAGAAVAPTRLQPSVPRPADFDAFWQAKIAQLEKVAPEPVLTPGDSGHPGVEYATVRLNNINGAHVYGQLARPSPPGKHPAMLIMQWASPPYPLQRAWVVDRAAEGWIALNVEPHDVPCDLPPAFYASLPQMIKDYRYIYDYDRDRNYFLQMYLGDYRALDYLASLPDWDGRTLVVTGTSMGGQQSVCVAGLHPKVTHLVVNEPAGADSNAALHGRAAGYPNWNTSDPRALETGLYFDTVNFAPRIKAKCLVSIGFVDQTAEPVGIWTAFNQIPGPKEVVPLIDSPHNNLATDAQQHPYIARAKEWFDALVAGREPSVSTGVAASVAAGN